MAKPDTRTLMFWVAAALLPGLLLQAWLFGYGTIMNMLIAGSTACLIEAICLKLRRRPVKAAVSDGSALVTALLIAAAIPPDTGAYPVFIAVTAGIVIGKHVYGGIGQNLFNPAMVGYAIALVSLPGAFNRWPVDGTTGATALDALKHRGAMTIDEVVQTNAFGSFGGAGWEWVNITFALGGIVLILRGIIRWRLPLTFLLGLALLSILFYDDGSSSSLGSPLMHMCMGGTMLAAFFILTDPVTHPNAPRAQVAFAIIAALTTFVIRGWGHYPDGIAFGVLLANAAAPYLERRLA